MPNGQGLRLSGGKLVIMGEPCGWEVAGCGCGGDCWGNYPPGTQARAEALATSFMWAATGRRYGLCELTVMPCNPTPVADSYRAYPVAYDVWGDGSGMPTPVIEGGQWRNVGGCGGGCRCAARCEVPLPGPVHSILAVTVDGEDIPTTAMEVHDRRVLVRIDGACWPSCQVYGLEIPGFEVTYLRGTDIPVSVQYATNALACEYAKACTGGACALPQRLASLSRQGVEVTVAQVEADKAKGILRTDIKAVDDVIAADNPYGLTEVREVFSPDYPPAARVITWAGGS